MAIARTRRLGNLEAMTQGDQIPIICEHESNVTPTIDRMIAAGELSEAIASSASTGWIARGPTPRATTT